jgi:hypothetical protein
MKGSIAIKVGRCALVLALVLASSARAQWQTTTYNLKGGWNSIYLSGDADHADIDTLFPNLGQAAGIIEIWRWNTNPDEVQFMDSPLIPSEGTPEWSVWKRGKPAETTFSSLTGRAAYLVRCTGTPSNTYNVAIKHSVRPPDVSWVRNGANFLGFPSRRNGASSPTFSSYFATFPAAIAANTKIFKYIGGELGPGNPIQVFSPSSEPLDRTQAYWFSSKVVGDFYAPVAITADTNDGLAFGRSNSVVTVRVRNRGGSPVTLTFAPAASESAPAGQTSITGDVPLTRRTFNTATLTWTETPVTADFTQVAGPQSTVELQFGINRTHPDMAAAANDAFFASLLRVTDSGNLMDVHLPVTARKTSLAGLWLGDVEVTNVSNKVSNGATATATVQRGAVSGITLAGGGYGYTSPPAVTVEAPVSGTSATAIAEVANGAVSSVIVTEGGSGYTRPPRVSFGTPPVVSGTRVPDISRFRLRTLLHLAADGSATLLPQVFIGQLPAPANQVGLCTSQSLLDPSSLATAQRFVAAHLPIGPPFDADGPASIPGEISFTVQIPYNDATNPFVHQYHPDHDNRKPRREDGNYPPGVESYDIARTATFTFTAAPPSGSTATLGWGSSVIGGTFREVLSGLHKDSIEVNGTFELRRASEIPTLTR